MRQSMVVAIRLWNEPAVACNSTVKSSDPHAAVVLCTWDLTGGLRGAVDASPVGSTKQRLACQ